MHTENFTVWCLAGVLAVVSTSFLALVFHYCYSRICKVSVIAAVKRVF